MRGRTVFAVEDTAAQLTWRQPRPGTAELTGLEPDGPVLGFPEVRTLRPPPGPELIRFAAMSDLHIGEEAFGLLRTMKEPRRGGEPYAVRCFRAAVAQAKAWGAQLLVLKGDLTDKGRPREWAVVAEIVGEAGLPVLAVPGNHDVWRTAVDGRGTLAGLHYDVHTHDTEGIRFVLGQSAHRGQRAGSVDDRQRQSLADAVAASPSGRAVVVLHHQPQAHRWRHYDPPGIPGPQANALLRALRDANPNTLVISGHTHRHRFWPDRPVPVAETGSPKDYPGTWTGYVVHAGGIRQVVRRVGGDDVLRWTERTRWAALGAWGLWSPGRLTDRCWVWPWPRP